VETDGAVREPPEVRIVEPDPAAAVRSDQGYVDLRWTPVPLPPQGAPGLSYALQQSGTAGFEAPVARYEGPDLGSVLTGFAEGDYWFRVRAFDPATGAAGPWSAALRLEVRYMPMGRVALFLVAGAAVFTLTLAAILSGHARAKREDTGKPQASS
jgi:hypothetical protein